MAADWQFVALGLVPRRENEVALMRYDKRQRGMSFVGVMALIVLIGFGALVGLKLFPIYMESFKIDTALQSVIEDPAVGNQSKHDIKMAVLRRFDIDDVRRITERNWKDHLQITKDRAGKVVIRVDYEADTSLFANLSLVAHFQKEVSN